MLLGQYSRCQLAEAENPAVIIKRPESLRPDLLGNISPGQAAHRGKQRHTCQAGCALQVSHLVQTVKAERGHGEELRLGAMWQGQRSCRVARKPLVKVQP